MLNQYPNGTVNKISYTEYRFDYFGQPVQWQIKQSQKETDYFFTILCGHPVFHKYFPDGEAKFPGLFEKSRDSMMERSDRIFFQNMIDSCDIA